MAKERKRQLQTQLQLLPNESFVGASHAVPTSPSLLEGATSSNNAFQETASQSQPSRSLFDDLDQSGISARAVHPPASKRLKRSASLQGVGGDAGAGIGIGVATAARTCIIAASTNDSTATSTCTGSELREEKGAPALQPAWPVQRHPPPSSASSSTLFGAVMSRSGQPLHLGQRTAATIGPAHTPSIVATSAVSAEIASNESANGLLPKLELPDGRGHGPAPVGGGADTYPPVGHPFVNDYPPIRPEGSALESSSASSSASASSFPAQSSTVAPSRVAWTAETPTTSRFRSGQPTGMGTDSPGGFALIQILENTTASPFRIDTENKNKSKVKNKDKFRCQNVCSTMDNGDRGMVIESEDDSDIVGVSSAPRHESISNEDGGDKWREAQLRLPAEFSFGGIDHCRMDGTGIVLTDGQYAGGTVTSEAGTKTAALAQGTDLEGRVLVKGAGDTDDAFDLPTQQQQHQSASAHLENVGRHPLSTLFSSDVGTVSCMDVGIIDWSLKCRLRIEGHPGRCLPGSSILSRLSAPPCTGTSPWAWYDDSAVDRLAMDMFVRGQRSAEGGAVGSHVPEEVMLAAKWRAAQMYWQHPAVYPVLQSDTMRQEQLQKGANAALSVQPETKTVVTPSSLSASLPPVAEASNLRGIAASFLNQQSLPVCFAGFGPSLVVTATSGMSTSCFEQVRRCESEWKEAFRSLYYAWARRIETLRAKVTAVETIMVGTTSTVADVSAFEEVVKACFFAVSADRIVLFRCRLRRDECGRLVLLPMIVLSSTTVALRSLLRSLGLNLRVFREADEKCSGQPEKCDEFTERIFDEGGKARLSQHEDDDARQVRAELDALRRATAHGEMAGAEISVSKKGGDSAAKSASGSGDKGVISTTVALNQTPICVIGDEDCMTFFESFFNTNGRLVLGQHGSEMTAPMDVPLLLSRSLGPCVHSKVSTLTVGGRRDDFFSEVKASRFVDNRDNSKSKRQWQEYHSSLEITGPILPCALRELLHTSACYMLADKKRQKEQLENERANGSYKGAKADKGVGSHYFVSRVQIHEGWPSIGDARKGSGGRAEEEAKRVTGGPTSAFLNGPIDLWDKQCDEGVDSAVSKPSACGTDEIVTMAVWDIARPSGLSFKTEVASAVIPTT